MIGPPLEKVVSTNFPQMPNAILQKTNLQKGPENDVVLESQRRDYIPESSVNVNLGALTNLVAKTSNGSTAKDIIVNFREKYGIVFIQQLSGEVNIFSFSSLMFVDESASIPAWNFDIRQNVFNLQYGDVTSDVDAVIVYGQGGSVGEAIDLLKVQAKGIAQDANGNYRCRYYRIERRDLLNDEDCQRVAREILLERNKKLSYTI